MTEILTYDSPYPRRSEDSRCPPGANSDPYGNLMCPSGLSGHPSARPVSAASRPRQDSDQRTLPSPAPENVHSMGRGLPPNPCVPVTSPPRDREGPVSDPRNVHVRGADRGKSVGRACPRPGVVLGPSDAAGRRAQSGPGRSSAQRAALGRRCARFVGSAGLPERGVVGLAGPPALVERRAATGTGRSHRKPAAWRVSSVWAAGWPAPDQAETARPAPRAPTAFARAARRSQPTDGPPHPAPPVNGSFLSDYDHAVTMLYAASDGVEMRGVRSTAIPGWSPAASWVTPIVI